MDKETAKKIIEKSKKTGITNVEFTGGVPEIFMEPSNNCILFFIKYPEPGRVKTRLADVIGTKAALGLYRCFIKDLLITLKNVRANILFCYTPADALKKFKNLLGNNNYYYFTQPDDTLGQRM